MTRQLNIHGFYGQARRFGHLSVYGSDAPEIQELMRSDEELAQPLMDALPYVGAQVVWAARHEMAQTVDDVLSRRTRALFLNAKAAQRAAPRVAELLARELGQDGNWIENQLSDFGKIASHFTL